MNQLIQPRPTGAGTHGNHAPRYVHIIHQISVVLQPSPPHHTQYLLRALRAPPAPPRIPRPLIAPRTYHSRPHPHARMYEGGGGFAAPAPACARQRPSQILWPSYTAIPYLLFLPLKCSEAPYDGGTGLYGPAAVSPSLSYGACPRRQIVL